MDKTTKIVGSFVIIFFLLLVVITLFSMYNSAIDYAKQQGEQQAIRDNLEDICEIVISGNEETAFHFSVNGQECKTLKNNCESSNIDCNWIEIPFETSISCRKGVCFTFKDREFGICRCKGIERD